MWYSVAMFKKEKELNARVSILVLICLSFVLATIRVIVSKEKGPLDHLFLIYNVGLAVIPSLLIYKYKNWHSKSLNNNIIWNWFVFFIAFIFMPNSFYVITDFIHISRHEYILGHGIYRTYLVKVVGYIDLLNIFICSVTATILGVRQIKGINDSILKNKNNILARIGLIACESILIAFAVYLGRFIRLNSWNILSLPRTLIEHRFTKGEFQFIFVYAVTVFGFNIAYMLYDFNKVKNN